MFKNIYEKLMSQQYTFQKGETKPVWEWIHDQKLTVCPCFEGKLYQESNLRLMVVGRAVNGWDVNTNECNSIESAVNMIKRQRDRFDDIVKAEGVPYIDSETGEHKVYHYSRSRFWKLIQYVLEAHGEGDHFNQRIVWSNLYKVAPYVTGNPAWNLVKPNMQTYIDCLVEEIRTYQPKHILFVTGMDYLNPWTNEPQFGEHLGIGEKNQVCFGDNPYESGMFEGAKIVVCGRPEKKSNENIRTMADEILEQFKMISID